MTMPVSFDAQMRAIHDHLYASANIRVPEDLQHEVAKCMQAITWNLQIDGFGRVDAKVAAGIIRGESDHIHTVARELRQSFAAYNKMMKRYPAREAIILDDASVAYVQAALNDVNMNDVSRDWLGDALEVFRSTAAKRLGGQFFTDQQVTRLAVELLEYEPANHDFVDVCAGTGGFLLAAAAVARQDGVENVTIKGIDADSSLCHLANSTLNQVGVIGAPVANANSLLMPDRWPLALRKAIIPGTHDRLATNPPFGQKITIKDPGILKRLDLAHIWSRKDECWQKTPRVSPTPPDILFIEQNVNLAAPGRGRLAIVLPYQVLSGPKLGYVRQWILQQTKVLAVVDLPDVTFQPWTGTKTSLLVCERRDAPVEDWRQDDHEIFMAVSRKIGHDRRGNVLVDAKGDRDSDLPSVARAFREFRAGHTISSHHEAFHIPAGSITWEDDLRLNAAFHEPSASGLHTNTNSEAQVRTIADVTTKIFFPGRFKRNYVPEGVGAVPFLGGTNITQLLPTNKKFLSATDPRISDYAVHTGWILVTRSGSTGIVSRVPAEWDGHAMSEHVIRIIPDENKFSGDLLEVYLRSSYGQKLISRGIFGSVIDEITPEFLGAIPVPSEDVVNSLQAVANLQREAEEARNTAISLSKRAVRLLEDAIQGEVGRIGGDTDLSLFGEDVVQEGDQLLESQVALQ